MSHIGKLVANKLVESNDEGDIGSATKNLKSLDRFYKTAGLVNRAVSTWTTVVPPINPGHPCWSPELQTLCTVGPNGGILTSYDATTWIQQTSPNTNNYTSVVWSAELKLFCAVSSTGINNRVMTSVDGVTWIARTTSTDAPWSSVCWSPELGLFCAVAYDVVGTKMTSSDGINWAFQTAVGSDVYLNKICWSPELGLFCAVGFQISATSSDGITWTTQAVAPTNWQSVCWSPELGLFCASGPEQLMTSTNGTLWSTMNHTNYWGDVCWSPELGLFCAISGLGSLTSPDGTNWTTGTGTGTFICWSPELGLFCAMSNSTPIIKVSKYIGGGLASKLHYGSAIPAATSNGSATKGTSLLVAREDHSHNQSTHAHTNSANGGALSFAATSTLLTTITFTISTQTADVPCLFTQSGDIVVLVISQFAINNAIGAGYITAPIGSIPAAYRPAQQVDGTQYVTFDHSVKNTGGTVPIGAIQLQIDGAIKFYADTVPNAAFPIGYVGLSRNAYLTYTLAPAV